jgi:D-sedoheptulose 7-phosphate isomerase
VTDVTIIRHSRRYLDETAEIASLINADQIEILAQSLSILRSSGGRLFILGLGGSAANASHAVNDFRKLCALEAYAPTDNVAELTARANDAVWDTIFSAWLQFAEAKDALLVLSVGGGTKEVSRPITEAIRYTKLIGMRVFGIVGKDGGYTKEYGDCVVVIPTIITERVTPHTEAFQAVVLHCLVSHPSLQRNATKW